MLPSFLPKLLQNSFIEGETLGAGITVYIMTASIFFIATW